ncbi:hypothetical protein B0H13DRAFT_1655419 [Mycena leptocephala]|nr:hypothetical protein B0H13DRAFT_1655419 [Mycena leptocephala]
MLIDNVEGLLEAFCPSAFRTLKTQKEAFLRHDEQSLYPTDSSIFSAATFELGGPHRQTYAGLPDRHQPGTWSILTSLGNYAPMVGGHIILWDLGLVVSFPAGSSILIPTSVLRYSFVRVRPGERRYSLIQWAGAGIFRWFLNGRHTDIEFATNATWEEHEARESRRLAAHAAALEDFPIEEELSEDAMILPFFGTNAAVVV